MKRINKLQLAIGVAALVLSSVSLAARKTTSKGVRGYVNNYDRVNFDQGTFTNLNGFTEALTSMHIVIQDLDRPSPEIAATCNMPDGVEWTAKNKLEYSLKYEHAFRAFVYVNTEFEQPENLVAVFMVSPGLFGVHVETSGLRTVGSYTDEGDFNVLDHNPGILAGEKIGPYEDKSIFDLYKSKASEGAPMFNAIFFKRGTALHGSNGIVDGNPRSHACVRFRKDESPLNQKLAMAVGGNVKVSIRDTEVFKSCYDREYRNNLRDEENALEESKKELTVSPAAIKAINDGQGGLF